MLPGDGLPLIVIDSVHVSVCVATGQLGGGAPSKSSPTRVQKKTKKQKVAFPGGVAPKVGLLEPGICFALPIACHI